MGLPISVSHALVGGIIGAGIVKGGVKVLVMKSIIKIATFIILSPLIGFFLGIFFFIVTTWIFRRWSPWRVDRLFRAGQLFSSALFSLGHGANDAQKTMGIIGVGSLRRLSAVKWGVAGNIVVAWVLTLPGSALISALGYLALKAFGVS